MKHTILMDTLILLRPKQWVKNTFVFLPCFFSGNITNLQSIKSCFVLFVSFCLMASSVYCINDVVDSGHDKCHPKKKFRPIASGKLTTKYALCIAAICALLAIVIAYNGINDNNAILVLLLSYLVINIAYCLKLKQLTIIDILTVATGFVMRVVGGGLAADIWISQWIIIMTYLLSLFLVLAKRRDDVFLVEGGNQVRKSIEKYSRQYLDQCISIVSAIIIVSYILYTLSDDVIARMHTNYLYVTSFWVLFGILRYLQLTSVLNKSGSPTEILYHDNYIKVAVVGWILSYCIIIYL
ncbi:MAG: decaprenyl-phosphate phosphoribosyltransferase [Bacteroidales bacterium]|nr:decaprenyl-phosphate phosphoribosyltransferase [Bacteroidales bacterium]